MKLQTKLYLFFAGIVLLPLLVMTVAASFVLGRSATGTYEGRLHQRRRRFWREISGWRCCMLTLPLFQAAMRRGVHR
jgi:hypothetical protein